MRRHMWFVAALSLAILVACYGKGPGAQGQVAGGSPSGPAFRYHHDDYHKVSCWSIHVTSIFCIPDSEVENPGYAPGN